MMKSAGEIKMQRTISLICAILFVAFSFTFLSVYQSPLLEVFYDKVATGKLMYNKYISAFVFTAILVLLALFINRYTKFQRTWTAMAYLPSSALLALATDLDRSIYIGEKQYLPWVTVSILVLLIMTVSVLLQRWLLFPTVKHSVAAGNKIIWHNLLLLSLFFLFTGTISNGDEDLKNEALAYVRYKHGDVDGALQVARKSNSATHEFTAARAFYLTEKSILGERLFEYPQQYAAEGLLPPMLQSTPLSPDSVYSLFRVKREPKESALRYLSRVVSADSVPLFVADYYLCALLLEKQLSEFVRKLPLFYDINNNADALPKHYKEALMLYSNIVTDYTLPFEDMEMLEAFELMQSIEEEHPDYHVRSNYVRRKFGKRYWWYYNYLEEI